MSERWWWGVFLVLLMFSWPLWAAVIYLMVRGEIGPWYRFKVWRDRQRAEEEESHGW